MSNNISNILIGLGLLAGCAALLTSGRNRKTNQITNTDEDMQLDKSIPRGYRNNNPLNIRISKSDWQGKKANNSDGVFEQFETMAYGYRAALKLIANYITKYDCVSVRKIISRWAPSNENNTEGYIKRVCNTTGFLPTTYINPRNENQMEALVYAMSLVENGTKMLPDKVAIQDGWNLYIS